MPGEPGEEAIFGPAAAAAAATRAKSLMNIVSENFSTSPLLQRGPLLTSPTSLSVLHSE